VHRVDRVAAVVHHEDVQALERELPCWRPRAGAAGSGSTTLVVRASSAGTS
jgi:hypothetical protein